MDRESKIYIAGHRGLVGTALCRRLQRHGYRNLLVRTSEELDLVRQEAVERLIAAEKPECIILVAANHGGVKANLENQAEFLYDNMMINFNVIHAAIRAGIGRLINIGASCVYPETIREPFRETMFLSGPVQQATEGYAWAKAMGMQYCRICNEEYRTKYVSLLPVNLYGRDVSFDPENTGVIPAMIRRFHQARKERRREVFIWGDGTARREFLHVDDLTEAVKTVLEADCQYDMYNVGGDELLSIQELAKLIAEVIGFEGRISNDLEKPGGAVRQRLNVDRIRELGWSPKISLQEGIRDLYQFALESGQLD